LAKILFLINFENKKIAFLYHNGGHRLIHKQIYFNYIKEAYPNQCIPGQYIKFSDAEKTQSGGFDGVFMCYSYIPLNKKYVLPMLKKFAEQHP
jgi:hypothetical protein